MCSWSVIPVLHEECLLYIRIVFQNHTFSSLLMSSDTLQILCPSKCNTFFPWITYVPIQASFPLSLLYSSPQKKKKKKKPGHSKVARLYLKNFSCPELHMGAFNTGKYRILVWFENTQGKISYMYVYYWQASEILSGVTQLKIGNIILFI